MFQIIIPPDVEAVLHELPAQLLPGYAELRAQVEVAPNLDQPGKLHTEAFGPAGARAGLLTYFVDARQREVVLVQVQWIS